VATRLEEAGISPDRFIRLQDGSKAPISHDTHPPEQVGNGNYGVYAGDGLVLVDIDDYRDDSGELPDEVQKLRTTLSITFRLSPECREMAVERTPSTFTANPLTVGNTSTMPSQAT
jgi:hypothetical protein